VAERREIAKQLVFEAYGQKFYKENLLACRAYVEAFAIYDSDCPGERRNTRVLLENLYKSQAE
jgi:hypothetical protein